MTKKLTCFACVLVAVLVLGMGCAACHADDNDWLWFDHTSSNQYGGYWIYQYYFNITEDQADGGGITNNVALMCLNFNKESNPGTGWYANEVKAGSFGIGNDYEKAAAILFQALYKGANIAEAQYAVWLLFDPNDQKLLDIINANSQFATDVQALLNGNYDLSQFADASIYLNDQQQVFLETPVPEPGTWALLGTGLLGFAILLYFRRRPQAVPRQLAS